MNGEIKNQLLLEYDNVYWKNNPILFQQLYNIVKINYRNHIQTITRQPKIRPKCKKITYPDTWNLYNWINEVTPKLKDPIYNIKTKIYWILHGISDFPVCANKIRGRHQIIGKNVITSTLGYRHHIEQHEIYCCDKCKYEDEKFASTIINKLHENFSDPEWYEKWYTKEYETRLAKYNGQWFDYEKIIKSVMAKYGVTNVNKLPEIRLRGIKTLKKTLWRIV